MKPRLDPRSLTAVRGPHLRATEGPHSPRLAATPAAPAAPRPRPRYGPVCDWLFAKGGMSALLLTGLIVSPVLAALPGPRLFASPQRRAAPVRPSPPSGRRAVDVAPSSPIPRVSPEGVIDRTPGPPARP